ncbi:MAG: S8 family serine peptidase [Bacteroidales bacterium]|nr:S8 family serine peptidase [Bacteroidales bacterium]
MKKIVAMALAAAFVICASAQERRVSASAFGPVSNEGMVVSTAGLSSITALLVADMLTGVADDVLQASYGLTYVDGELSVALFAVLADDVKISEFEHYNVVVKSVMGNRATLQVPLSRLVELSASGLCKLLDVGVKAYPRLDVARVAMGVEDAYNGVGLPHPYDGSGVVVGIIDVGFQYDHPAFMAADGSGLRVKRVWNQTARTGTRPSGYNYGAEYTTEDAILAAKYSSKDEVHGTHVAGIAAGIGGLTPEGAVYRGMAPASEIVLVATTMTDAGLYDGIQYIYNYAQSQGKPCVINMSIGSHVGPHDGTSSFDRQCDAFIDNHPTGLLLVGAAGNEGADRLHLSHTFAGGDTLLTTLRFTSGWFGGGSGYVDIWGSAGSNIEVACGIIDSITGDFDAAGDYRSASSAGTFYDRLTDSDGEVTSVQFSCTPNTQNSNNCPNITLAVDASRQSSRNQKVLVAVVAPEGTTVHLWGTQCGFSDCNFPMLSAGNNDCSVGEVGGVGNSIISVGAYTTKNEWITASARYISMASKYPLNELASFSSHGPTADGRVKPDVTAPGWVVAPINRYCRSEATTNNSYVVTTVDDGSNTEYYAIEAGTSMATPCVTGMLALWLQRKPDMSTADALSLIQQTSTADSYTGTIPSNSSNLWGWGKANAWAGLRAWPSKVTDLAAAGVAVGCQGLTLNVAGCDGRQLTVVDMSGRVVVTARPTGHALYNLPTAGIYIVMVDGKPAAKVAAIR